MKAQKTLEAIFDPETMQYHMPQITKRLRAKKVPFKSKKGTLEHYIEKLERDRLRKAAKRPVVEAVLNDGIGLPKFHYFGNPPL